MELILKTITNRNTFTIRGKGEIIPCLICVREVKKREKIYLATDPDREGEARDFLASDQGAEPEKRVKVYRITFNEIHENAVKESLKHPRGNRHVAGGCPAGPGGSWIVWWVTGFPLWAKVKRGLSAGRVSSRLPCV